MWPREYHIILKYYDLITGLFLLTLKIQDALGQKLKPENYYIYIYISAKNNMIHMCSVYLLCVYKYKHMYMHLYYFI